MTPSEANHGMGDVAFAPLPGRRRRWNHGSPPQPKKLSRASELMQQVPRTVRALLLDKKHSDVLVAFPASPYRRGAPCPILLPHAIPLVPRRVLAA